MKTATLLLIGAALGAYFQNLAWDYDSFGMAIVWLPGIPILAAAVLCWRKGVR